MNNICKQRRSPKETEALNIWTLICMITRGTQHSATPCTHKINEYNTESFTLGNKFCKIFSYYKFLFQLVFAPHFKQRHIPQYNYIKWQQQKNPGGMDRSNDPWTWVMHVLNQRFAKSFCFWLLTTVLRWKSNAPQGGPHLG